MQLYGPKQLANSILSAIFASQMKEITRCSA